MRRRAPAPHNRSRAGRS